MSRNRELAVDAKPAGYTVGTFHRHTGTYKDYWTVNVSDSLGYNHNLTNQHGSWLVAQGDSLREPEAVLGREVGYRLKVGLSDQARKMERALRDA